MESNNTNTADLNTNVCKLISNENALINFISDFCFSTKDTIEIELEGSSMGLAHAAGSLVNGTGTGFASAGGITLRTVKSLYAIENEIKSLGLTDKLKELATLVSNNYVGFKNTLTKHHDFGNSNDFTGFKCLGDKLTPEQLKMIQARDYSFCNLGDYWEVSSPDNQKKNKIVIHEFEYFANSIESGLSGKGHILVMNHNCLHLSEWDNGANSVAAYQNKVFTLNNIAKTSFMNSTNTTAGGYKGTLARSRYLPEDLEYYRKVFGEHILPHKELLTNSLNGNEWVEVMCEIPNTMMVYGIVDNKSWLANEGNIGNLDHQVALARLDAKNNCKSTFSSEDDWWLRDVANATQFGCVESSDGDGSSYIAGDNGISLRSYVVVG